MCASVVSENWEKTKQRQQKSTTKARNAVHRITKSAYESRKQNVCDARRMTKSENWNSISTMHLFLSDDFCQTLLLFLVFCNRFRILCTYWSKVTQNIIVNVIHLRPIVSNTIRCLRRNQFFVERKRQKKIYTIQLMKCKWKFIRKISRSKERDNVLVYWKSISTKIV